MSKNNLSAIWGVSNMTSTSNYGINYQMPSRITKYHILGEDVEFVNMLTDYNLITIIATLNILGRPFYEELKKNGYNFPKDIEDFLQKKFKEIDREIKISQVIN